MFSYPSSAPGFPAETTLVVGRLGWQGVNHIASALNEASKIIEGPLVAGLGDACLPALLFCSSHRSGEIEI